MNFIESILEQFGVKSPNLEPTFRAMLIGDDMAYFENIRSIKCFSPTRIILLIKKGEVTIEGEDLCTLLTCTPYGINSHRLLVRGVRIENAAPVIYVTSNAYRIDSLVATPMVAAPILFILLIVLMVKYRDKGSKPLISKEEEEWQKEN